MCTTTTMSTNVHRPGVDRVHPVHQIGNQRRIDVEMVHLAHTEIVRRPAVRRYGRHTHTMRLRGIAGPTRCHDPHATAARVTLTDAPDVPLDLVLPAAGVTDGVRYYVTSLPGRAKVETVDVLSDVGIVLDSKAIAP